MTTTRQKPSKPRSDFPLYWHTSGQWCKRIKGKLYYFGTDAKEAEQKYLDEREYLQAGRIPPSRMEHNGGTTLDELVNKYLAAQRNRVGLEDGISPLTYDDYKVVVKTILDHFGRNVDPTALTKAHFADFRNTLQGGDAPYSPSRLTKVVTVTKMIFRWGYEEADIIDKPPKFGKSFKGAGKKAVRKRRNDTPKAFDRGELVTLLEAADPTMKALILMGVNCGFGNNDITLVPKSAVRDGWVEFPRPKTEIPRRIKLWPETLAALDAMPEPTAREGLGDRLFLTSKGGEWVAINSDGVRKDYIAPRFRRLMNKCGCYRDQRGFYGLRHTTETIGGGCKDQIAVDAIMGHEPPGMGTNYRHNIEDARLQAVTDHVRAWLFPKSNTSE